MHTMEDDLHRITLTDKQLARERDVDSAQLQEGIAMIEEEKNTPTSQASRPHWRAGIFSLVLSSALIMEGYDAVIVSLE
jgi:hypothetical protein